MATLPLVFISPSTKVTAVNENNQGTLSFDRMRSMLLRAAEVRESEQQQVFDALDEIHARLSPLESLGSVRKRLSELPDRTDTTELSGQLNETLTRLDTQDQAIAALHRAVDNVVDKLAKPFAQLDGRLDGVSGRFEGVAGRMDGLEDKLSHIHKRLDDLDLHLDKQDGRVEALPSSVHGPVRERLESLETAVRARLDEVDEGVHEHLDGTREALQRSLSENNDTLRTALSEVRDDTHGKLDDLMGRPAVDPTDRLDALAARLESLAGTLSDVTNRLDLVEDGFAAKMGELSGAVHNGMRALDSSVANRPDADRLVSLVRKANQESEDRHAGQLDEAMATFAELILGGGPAAAAPAPPTTLPQRSQRRVRKPTAVNGSKLDKVDEELAAEGA